MHRFATSVALSAFCLAVGAPAANAETLLASDPQSFSNFFYEQGFPAHLTTDEYGDPFIEFRHDDTTYPLFFFDCIDNTDCLSVQLYIAYKMDAPVPLEKLNEWNSGGRRFLRAYSTSEDNLVHLAMDVATSKDGISARDFNDLLQLWFDRVEEFEDFIGW